MFYTKTFYNLVIITIHIQQVNPMVERPDYKVISVRVEEPSGHGITVRFWNQNAIAFKTARLGVGSEVLIKNLVITPHDWTCSLSSTDYTTIKVNLIIYLSSISRQILPISSKEITNSTIISYLKLNNDPITQNFFSLKKIGKISKFSYFGTAFPAKFYQFHTNFI